MAQTGNSGASVIEARAANAFRVSRGYLNYVIAVLWVVMLLRFVDLQIVAVLLESIRREFEVSDTLLGFMTGSAFAIFYGTLGIPIAWLADRYNRRNIIAAALGLWSAMTAACGLAGSFATLFLARMGVGVGEAGGQPPAYSLVSDYVPPERRSSVFAILNSAVPFGVFCGFIIGGWVNLHYGWRAAFMVVGLPGVLLALLIWLTVREPPRGFADKRTRVEALPLGETLAYLWRTPSYRHLVLATTIFTLGAIGSGIWIPSFFVRVHGMANAEVAVWLAFIYGGGGVLGAMLGGFLAERLVARYGDQRWYAWLSAVASAAILPFSFFVYLWPDPVTALSVHIGTTILMHSWMGPAYGTVQSLAGVSRRAMATAINGLAVNLVALGLGPLLVGAASDYFNPRFGENSLRYSILAVVVICYSWAALHFLLASHTLRQDLAAAEAG
jgi:predicted MFS family arabinose efflux permease